MPVSKKPRKKRAVKRTPAASSSPIPLPDRRAMEGFMAQLGGGPRDETLAQAQDVMYGAWEERSRQRRIALALKALKISPLCADAYVLLAEDRATTAEESREFYAKGVEAGELALGKQAFVDDVGHFWGILETRPYMRARAGLGQALRVLGKKDQSIAHYREMLRLNPNDNQGIRYLLAAGLLEIGDDAALEGLLDSYAGDIAADWAYSKALLAYRQEGDSERSRQLLTEAWEVNTHVPAYLGGKKALPELPEYISFGGVDEAVAFVYKAGEAWRRTAGAVAWLTKTVSDLPPLAKAHSSAVH